jgi:hypothetical protein
MVGASLAFHLAFGTLACAAIVVIANKFLVAWFQVSPDQVAVLNRVFSPAPDKVEYARRVLEAFEDGLKRGTASVSLDGKMVDIPIYRRAQVVFQRARAIAELEKRKAEILARFA